MLGITKISSYKASKNINNYEKKELFSINDDFIKNKIGFENLKIKDENESVISMCLKACENLNIDLSNIDCLVLVSQNQDIKIPHSSALLQSELNLSKNCACYDIALACSGYVYALSNIISFMNFNGLQNGLLFTCDPYSKIIDKNDKNTVLLFGDAATVTYISKDYKIEAKNFAFGTDGSAYKSIFCEKDILSMNGQAVFNFAATTVVKHINDFLSKNNLNKDDIDLFLFHQGSKYIIDTLSKRLNLNPDNVPFLAASYGNTVSSSIPLMLENFIKEKRYDKILITGFGTGLSYASGLLKFKEDKWKLR